jgi:hypothetical protein
MRYNPPPNWPQPPKGWKPEPGWAPDPAWGPPPARWELWVLERGESAYLGSARIHGLAIPKKAAGRSGTGVHVSQLGLHVGKKGPEFLIIEWPAVTRLEIAGSEVTRTNTKGGALTHNRGSGHLIDQATVFGARSNSVASTSVYLRAYGLEVTMVVEASPAAARALLGPVLIHLEQEQAGVPQAQQLALAAPDPILQLEGLGRLRDAGVIAPDEFETKKREILGRL